MLSKDSLSHALGLVKAKISPKFIQLNEDWDSPENIGKQSAKHIKRNLECDELVDFITRSKSGVVLISGKRGVGKSSLVFAAINYLESRTKNDSQNKNKPHVIPIVINASDFETIEKIKRVEKINGEKEDSESASSGQSPDSLLLRRELLQNIVRKLYQATRALTDDGLPIQSSRNDYRNQTLAESSGISELFTKAIATEVKQTINIGELEKENKLTEREFSLDLKDEKVIGIAASFLTAGIITLNPIIQGSLNQVLAILTAAVPSGLLLSWKIRRSNIAENNREKNDQLYYRHDYDTTALQSDLEEKLSFLQNRNYKIVFVIDELDKISLDLIKSTIKYLKPFFNQSSCLFILISGDEFFELLLMEEKERSIWYTLFPHRIFIQRPLFNQMELFIDNITIKETRDPYYDDYRKFRNYLSYISKSDFFDLNKIIRDYITYDEKQGLRIDIYLRDKKQNLKAEIQKVIGQIFLRKRYAKQSDWHKNDKLLDIMYDLTDDLIRLDYRSLIRINDEGELKLLTVDLPNIESKKYTDFVHRSTVLDLIRNLEKLEFLKRLDNESYEVTGNIQKVPKNPVVSTDEERMFMESFENLRITVYNFCVLIQSITSVDYAASSSFLQNVEILQKFSIIRDSPSYSLTSQHLLELYDTNTLIQSGSTNEIDLDKLIAYTKEANTTTDELLDNILDLVKRGFERSSISKNVTDSTIGETFKLFNYMVDKAEEMKSQDRILRVVYYGNENEKNIFILKDPSQNLLRYIKNDDINHYIVFLTHLKNVGRNDLKLISEPDFFSFVANLDNIASASDKGENNSTGQGRSNLLMIKLPFKKDLFEKLNDFIFRLIRTVDNSNSRKPRHNDEPKMPIVEENNKEADKIQIDETAINRKAHFPEKLLPDLYGILGNMEINIMGNLPADFQRTSRNTYDNISNSLFDLRNLMNDWMYKRGYGSYLTKDEASTFRNLIATTKELGDKNLRISDNTHEQLEKAGHDPVNLRLVWSEFVDSVNAFKEQMYNFYYELNESKD